MTAPQHFERKEELLAQMTQRAVALWGEARAKELATPIEQLADVLVQLSRSLPGREEEPAFFW